MACLAADSLRRLVEGDLPTADRPAAEAHLQHCLTCRETAQHLRADADLFHEIKVARAELRPAAAESDLAGDALDGIAGYRPLGEVRRGGQGVVLKAVQLATHRVVAVKVLLNGRYATPRQRLRFEREIDLAAQLRHPHIVTIHDSGVNAGRPYLVMEYIDGRPLDEFLRDRALPVRERLQLFHLVCAAVGHAHQRGVIHRDLKPGNILIDDAGQPHVLDFGAAKLTEPGASDEEAPLTATGEFLGTLAYAAPEQARGEPALTDTRTDVYALGVVLYEMLTGDLPYEVRGTLASILTNIATAEPRPPSHHCPDLDADIDTIVLKALAKEPERRYATALDLGRDIERFLAGRAIDARRDSLTYLLGKALRRHRLAVGTAAAFLVVLLGALATSLTFWRLAVGDRDRAKQAETEEHRQREAAEWQAYVANIAAANASLEANDVVAARHRLDMAPSRLRNWEWGWLHGRLDDSARTQTGHTAYVEDVAYSPDGTQLASASWDKSVRVTDRATGRLLAEYRAPAEVYALAYHPRGDRLALGCWDGRVRVWNPTSGQPPVELRVPAPNVWAVAFDRDGGRLAAACNYRGGRRHHGVVVWRTDTGDELATFSQDDLITNLAFLADGRRLVTAGLYGLQTWDLATGRAAQDALPRGDPTGWLAVDPAGQRLAVALGDASIRVSDAGGAEVARLRGHTQPINALAFSRDGSLLASGARDKTIRLWDVARGVETAVLRGHAWTVSALAFSPDGTTIASGGWDNVVKFWHIDSPGAAARLRRHTGRIPAVAWHPDGRRLATGGADGQVVVGDLDGGTAWCGRHDGPVRGAAFSHDGTLLVTASADRTIALWDAASGKLLRRLEGHSGAVHAVAFTPDGQTVVSAGGDRSIRFWDIATGQLRRTTTEDTPVFGMAISSDGRRIAIAGQNVIVVRAANGERVASFARTILHEAAAPAFQPNGVRVAASSEVGTIAIWDECGSIVALRGHSDEVRGVAFSPDGTRLASTSLDGTIRVWDVAAGVELAHVRAAARTLAFSPDGRHLAVGGDDGVAIVWTGTPAGGEP